MTDRFIGYFRLVEACAAAGCPVCRCLEDDSRRALAAILYEHVTDPETRRALRAAGGFCNWHAWSLLEAGNAATGAAIVCEDLIRQSQQRLERAVERRAGPVRTWRSRLRALLGRSSVPAAPRGVDEVRRHPRCPVCARLAVAEQAYAETVVHFIGDRRFAGAYARSSGLCLPHLVLALERRAAGEEIATLVHTTLARWSELRGRLERFVAKQEYRNPEPITPEEGDSYRLATEILAGRRQLFGNDRRERHG